MNSWGFLLRAKHLSELQLFSDPLGWKWIFVSLSRFTDSSANLLPTKAYSWVCLCVCVADVYQVCVWDAPEQSTAAPASILKTESSVNLPWFSIIPVTATEEQVVIFIIWTAAQRRSNKWVKNTQLIKSKCVIIELWLKSVSRMWIWGMFVSVGLLFKHY